MPGTLRWGPFELDLDAHELRRAGAPIPTQPQTFAVIHALASRLGQAVPRAELFAAAWPGARVVDDALTQAIRRARVALDDDPRDPRRLLTVPRVGYRLVEAAPEVEPAAEGPEGLVGRRAELAALGALLAGGARLVTVLGTGGVGKTRLVRQFWVEARGTWWVDAEAARDAEALRGVVARAMGSADVADRAGLLVLDNLEQVASAAGPVVEGWLAVAPALRVVVTSRLPLRTASERTLRLDPLAPDDALTLFHQRSAAAARSDGAVGELIARLDGLPLAIELAAARTRFMSPTDLLARIGRRLALTGAEDRPARHETLRRVLDGSWELASAGERADLASLSAFVATFSLDAAEAVLGDGGPGPERLGRLVDAGLVQVDLAASRYRLLELIRDYATERRLASPDPEGPSLRHGAWYAALGEAEALRRSRGSGSAARLRGLTADYADLVAACDRAVARGDGAVAAGAALAAMQVDELVGLVAEGADRLARVRAVHGAEPRRVELLCGEGGLRRFAGQPDAAGALLEEALALVRSGGDVRGEGVVLGNLGNQQLDRGLIHAAVDTLRVAVERSAAAGDLASEGVSRLNLGRALGYAGQAEAGERELHAALAALRSAGTERVVAIAVGVLALAVGRRGGTGEAAALFEEALALHRAIGDEAAEASTLGAYGALLAELGRHADALRLIEQEHALNTRLGRRRALGVTLDNRAYVRKALGDLVGARSDARAALALHRAVGNRRAEAYCLTTLGALCVADGQTVDGIALIEQGLSLARELGAARFAAAAALELGRARWTVSQDAAGALAALDEAEAHARPVGEAALLANLAALRAEVVGAVSSGSQAR